MAATQELGEGQLIGLTVSENLFRRGDMGYSLVITREAITGAKKPDSMGDYEAYLGPGANPTEAEVGEAKRIAEVTMRTAEFHVPLATIGQVLFKRPGMFSGGYVIIKTRLDSIKIDIAVISTNSPRILETSKKLGDSLATAVGERFHDAGNSLF